MNIWTRKLKKSANMLNSKGFTLLEMLVCFAILSTIISLIPLGFKLILNQDAMEKRLQRMEWDVFINQLRYEVQSSESIQIVNGKLVLRIMGENVIFEKYGTNIRRMVDYRGHEISLQKVDHVQFNDLDNGVEIIVEDQYGNEHISRLYTLLDLESVP